MLLGDGKDNDLTLVESLKDEVQALKSRCDALEKTVRNLKSICDTHQNTLETFRQHIINLCNDKGRLDMSYEGESFDAMQ